MRGKELETEGLIEETRTEASIRVWRKERVEKRSKSSQKKTGRKRNSGRLFKPLKERRPMSGQILWKQ